MKLTPLFRDPIYSLILEGGNNDFALGIKAIIGNAKSEEVKRKRMECFKFANSAFPIYLPFEQHKTFPSDLNLENGEYWGNAIHFLLSNKAHGFPLWKQFQEQLRSMGVSDTCRRHISEEKAKSILKDSSGEPSDRIYPFHFPLEDSVLMQLPFQPVLLLQWLASTTSLLVLFESQFCVFYNVPFLKVYEPQISHLQNILKESYLYIGFLFDYLQHQAESENEIFVGNLKLFDKLIQHLIQAIMIFSDKQVLAFINVVKFLSYLQVKPKGPLCKLKSIKSNLEMRNFVFNLDFWRSVPHKDLQLFGSSEEILKVKREVKKREELTFNQVDELFQDCFGGSVLARDFINRVMKNSTLMELIHEAHILKNLCLTEFGAIGGFLSIIDHLNFRNKIFQLCGKLAKMLDEPPGYIFDFVEAITKDSCGIELEAVFSKAQRDQFGLQRSLQKFQLQKATFQPSATIAERVDCFQRRIKRIVLECVGTQLEIKNFEMEKDEKLRDWQVVQYLLPCFVASYSDICQHDPPFEETMKVWYAEFIDRLIGAYEEKDGVRKCSWANIKKDIDANPVLKDNTKLLQFFEDVVREGFNQKIKDNKCGQIKEFTKYIPLWGALYDVLKTCKDGKTEHKIDISSEPSMYWNWLMWDFFSKMKHALSTINKL